MSTGNERVLYKAPPIIKRPYPDFLRSVAVGAQVPINNKPTATQVLPNGPTPNTVVHLDMQVMLRVATHCTENAPSIIHGELIGLEVAPGCLEVSDCFLTPMRKDIWNPRERPDMRELEEKHRKEVERYRQKMRELLDYVDADCQSVGWFQTMANSALNDPTVVEKLYQRMSEIDRSSVILCFDLERNSNGLFPFRAFHLSENYIKLRCRQESGDLPASNVIRILSTSAIFTELQVRAKSVVAVDALLLQLRPNASKELENTSRNQGLMSLDQLDRGLKFLSSALEEFTAEGERLMRSQKDANRYHQRRDRKRPDDELDEDGREKKYEAPSHLKSLLVRGHVEALATAVAQVAQENVAHYKIVL